MKTKSSSADFLLLDELSDDVLITIVAFLGVRSLAQLLQTSKRFARVEAANREFLWETYVLSQYGKLRTTATSSSWKDLARDLYTGQGVWHGFAIDEDTARFEPYPMEFRLDRHHQSSPRYCTMQWRTLHNSRTRVEVHDMSRRNECDLLHEILFSEVELLQGANIMIPTRYRGVFCGPSIIGIYAGGGAFFLLRSEALSEMRRSTVFQGLPGALGWNERVETVSITEGKYFSGIAVFVLVRDRRYPIEDCPVPEPTTAMIDLFLDEEISSPTTEGATITARQHHGNADSRHFTGRIKWMCDYPGCPNPLGVHVDIRLNTREHAQQQHDILITAGSAFHWEDRKAPVIRNPLQTFLEGATLYGFLQGDCIIGIQKNGLPPNRARPPTSNAGSFYLQMRDHNRLQMLGLRKLVEG